MNLRGAPNRDSGVVVTGLGIVSAIGVGVPAFGENLFAGRSGIAPIRSFDASRFRCRIGAEVPEIDFLRHVEAKELKLLDRLSLLAIAAADEAIADAGLDLERDRAALGVIVGTGLGPSAGIEDCVRRVATDQRLRPTTLLRVMLSSPAATLCERYQCREVSHVHVTACAASAHAVAHAADYIRRGELDLCLVVGCDAFPSEAAFASWDALGVMSPDNDDPSTASRPFSADRSGIVIGEGAAALIMESEGRARARAARIHAGFAGAGSTSHTPNLTLPSVEGMASAMARALDRSGLAPEQVGYINAHGTGTGMNDALETRALHEVFGAHAARLRISSTKAAHGHVMGASGAVEALATILSLRDGIAAPTLNLRQPDPACDLDFTANVARPMDCTAALSNSFAFGGHYVSLAFTKENS
jgi:3-oxoacyl-[acyl-carrier-protein] synthase II